MDTDSIFFDTHLPQTRPNIVWTNYRQPDQNTFSQMFFFSSSDFLLQKKYLKVEDLDINLVDKNNELINLKNLIKNRNSSCAHILTRL